MGEEEKEPRKFAMVCGCLRLFAVVEPRGAGVDGGWEERGAIEKPSIRHDGFCYLFLPLA